MPLFVPTDYLVFSDAINHIATVREIPKHSARDALRHLLYNGQVPSKIITGNGQSYDIPKYLWGGRHWRDVLQTETLLFNVAANTPAEYGHVIIHEATLAKALDSRPVTKINEPKRPEDDDPAIPKKTKTRNRNKNIYDLYTTTIGKNPSDKETDIYEKMRTEQPNLFVSLRTVDRKKGISNQTIERIIRAQRRQ